MYVLGLAVAVAGGLPLRRQTSGNQEHPDHASFCFLPRLSLIVPLLALAAPHQILSRIPK